MPECKSSRRRSTTAGAMGAWLVVMAMLAVPAIAQEPPKPSQPAPSLARQRSAPMVEAKGSQGWWMGAAASLAALVAAGALCLAARGKAAGATAARLQVVGRVHLPPRHTLFLVRAGRRTLLIGAGPQGSPSLLGELDDEESEPPADPIAARLDAAASSLRGARSPARLDVRLGDEP